MARAVFNGDVIADSNDVVEVDGYTYFPMRSVRAGVLASNAFTTVCSSKGTASYYDVTAGGKTIARAAFAYPDPTPAASEVRGRIAFWKAVEVDA
jgi:uncharacterized protein (DUF427 family)